MKTKELLSSWDIEFEQVNVEGNQPAVAELKRLAEWFKNASDDMFADHVNTYYGDQSVHALLERTTWHAAQHLRHVYALMEMMDITPEAPLDPSDLEGLPLPDSPW
jgi:hypothetical protein